MNIPIETNKSSNPRKERAARRILILLVSALAIQTTTGQYTDQNCPDNCQFCYDHPVDNTCLLCNDLFYPDSKGGCADLFNEGTARDKFFKGNLMTKYRTDYTLDM